MKNYNWAAQSAHGAIVLSSNKPKVVNQIGSWVYDGNDFMIVGIARRNPNWKDSLIDLSKNDYIIKDGILMATRKHAALIHAWADGALIQVKFYDSDKWVDCVDNAPAWNANAEYRIKPKAKTMRFRNYISRADQTIRVTCDCVPSDLGEWLGEWQEVEVGL